MNILLSGASSFTGYWFGRLLAEAGHQVTTLYRGRSAGDYQSIRKDRVEALKALTDQTFSCTLGEKRFLEVAASQPWDVYCHHASDVTNYRSPDFDPIAATRSNTHNLPHILKALRNSGCDRLLVTGSVFERGEGQGSDRLPAISRYGLSKTLSWEVFLFEALELGFSLGKFVIPNPFGPMEEPRYTSYLARTWKNGETAGCRTPLYVRDNIPVDLLAREYLEFVGTQPEGLSKCYPSGYVESQGRFTERVACEFRRRTDWSCEAVPAEQAEFDEPMIRINSRPSALHHPNWDESAFWDHLVDFYAGKL